VLVEASREQIGSFVDQLLLFCFHYDPATGRYSRVALNAVRAGGVLTLAVLGAFIVVMLRRDRARGTRPPVAPSGSETRC
jgi:protein SCO1